MSFCGNRNTSAETGADDGCFLGPVLPVFDTVFFFFKKKSFPWGGHRLAGRYNSFVQVSSGSC